MKNIFLIALSIIPLFTPAQNIEFQKIIDDNVQIMEYDHGSHPLIHYQKVANGMILRFEDLKVQLYDINFERKAEINLTKFTKSGTDYDRFATAFDNEFIYIMQYNRAGYLGTANSGKAQLHKIDYEGRIIKSIDFYEVGKIEYVFEMEKEMLLIDEKIFVLWSGSPSDSKSTDSNSKIDLFNITILNNDLTQIENTISLPHKISGTEQTSFWNYDGKKDDAFIFRRFYSKNKNGEFTTLVSSDNTRWYEYIEVTKNLEKQNYRNGNADETEDFNIHLTGNYKYDTSIFHINYEGVKLHIGDLPYRFPMDVSKPAANLFLCKGEIKSDKLFDGFVNTVDKNFKYTDMFYIHRIFADPINNSVNIIVGYYTYGLMYLFTFNDELKIIAVTEYVEGTKMGGANEFGHEYSFNYGCFSYKRTWGDINSNHKINALEYSTQFGIKSHVTVINYDDYQILLLDNKLKKTSTVYKIVG
ncbi:MAG: hypothetical protein HYZ14_13925 [Bacteroidetes bacterium]|nr:hypothetical protein [Bacteroidota bacterium]